MSPKATRLIQALVVEVIRRLWNRGLYQQNKWVKACHDNWFEIWVEWKTDIVMRNVDAQVEQIMQDWDMEEPNWTEFTEEEEGETALGSEMRIRHKAFDE